MVSGRVKKFNSELSFRVWPLFSLHLHTNMTQERVIYEVSLDIDDDVCIEFFDWLTVHVDEMLELPGFLNAKLMKVLDSGTKEMIVVAYELKSHADLQNYFDIYAANMRGDGVKKFAGKFSATRRVLQQFSEVGRKEAEEKRKE